MKNFIFILVFSFFISTPIHQVHAQGTALNIKPDETYVQESTQFRFPPQIGEFKRVDICQYDQKGLDISGGYNQYPLKIIATVYVYPVNAPFSTLVLKSHFNECASHIEKHPQATLVSKGDYEITPTGKSHKGLSASYTFPATDFPGFPAGEILNSELYIFPFTGNRMVKFRITYPKANEEGAKKAIKFLLNNFVWPSSM